MKACHPRQQLYWKIVSLTKHMYLVVIRVVGLFSFCCRSWRWLGDDGDGGGGGGGVSLLQFVL